LKVNVAGLGVASLEASITKPFNVFPEAGSNTTIV